MNEIKKIPKTSNRNNQLGTTFQERQERLKSNTFIYFQIGLVLCLLLAYALLETNFKNEAEDLSAYVLEAPEVKEEFLLPSFKIYKEPITQSKPKQSKAKILTTSPTIVPNDTPDVSALKQVFTEPEPSSNLKSSDIVLEKEPVDNDEIFNMMGVEVVPVYPGCESLKTNDARKSCMSQKLTQLIQRKFNTNLASEGGLDGVQRISVQFKINAQGKVTDIKARAPNGILEKEAIRVIENIPQMTPGKQRNKNVSVIYTMPILFKVQN